MVNTFICLSGTFAVISLMIGSVTVREVPDSMLFLNGTDEYIRTRDEKRVQVAVALTALVGLFQVPKQLNTSQT